MRWRARRRASAASTCRCCRDPHAARPRPRARAARRRARRRRGRARRRSRSPPSCGAAGVGERADVVRLPGRLLVPGLVNGHSHAFQRHLRGRVEVRAPAAPEDDFWSWREAMYAAADALDPRAMRAVAEECFDAGRRAGYTTVGEFHYVHHRPDGTPYEEPNELALAVIEAARAVGIRIVLLLAAYARGGAGRGPTPGQRRFCDRSVEAYLGRVERLAAAVEGDPLVSVGYAPHSLRAVPREWLVTIAGHAAAHRLSAARARRRAAARGARSRWRSSACGRSSTSSDCGVLGPRATVVHATHVSRRRARPAGADGLHGVRLPDHRGQSGRRLPAGCGALGARRRRLVRRRLQRAPRPVRGGPRDRGLRAPPERPAQRARGRRRRRPGSVALALPHDHGARSLGLRRAGHRCRRARPTWSRSTWRIRTSAAWSRETSPRPSSSAAPPPSCARPGSPALRRQLRERRRAGLAIGRTALSCVRRCGSAMLRSALVAPPAASQPAATLARA